MRLKLPKNTGKYFISEKVSTEIIFMNGDILKFKNKYRAESARLRAWDYSQNGCYFVTICVIGKKMFFGDVVGNENEARVELSEIGEIADRFWLEIPRHFPFVRLYEHIIMPNHVHGIIEIDREDDNNDFNRGNDVRRDEAMPRLYEGDFSHLSKILPKQGSLSVIVGSFKSVATKIINQKFPEINFAWQSRFYDRIIRNEDEFGKIREYIINNPLKWELDKNNPKNLFM